MIVNTVSVTARTLLGGCGASPPTAPTFAEQRYWVISSAGVVAVEALSQLGDRGSACSAKVTGGERCAKAVSSALASPLTAATNSG